MLNQFFKNIPLSTLKKVQSLDMNTPTEECHEAINSLLQNTVLLGGKRLRPLLTLLMGNLFEVNADSIVPYARAIEMVHGASLAHDDVIDNATTRRGKPSINVQSSNKMAVLAGDYLLSAVIGSLTKEGNLTLVREMADIIQDLSEGEWIQLSASANRTYSRQIIEEIALKKTASVMSWCCVAPAHLADLPSPVIEYARQFGISLGLGFQLMDDVLDFSGDSQKDYGLDLKNGIVNSVLYEWLAMDETRIEKFKKGESLDFLLKDQNLSCAVSNVKDRAHSRLNDARNYLDIMEKELVGNDSKKQGEFSKNLKPLLWIVDFLENRSV